MNLYLSNDYTSGGGSTPYIVRAADARCEQQPSMADAPKPDRTAMYTWQFHERSWIIRLYLWLYHGDKDQLSFCKLFWGMVCLPITLPVMLVVLAGKRVGHGLMRAGDNVNDALRGRHDRQCAKAQEARNAARAARAARAQAWAACEAEVEREMAYHRAYNAYAIDGTPIPRELYPPDERRKLEQQEQKAKKAEERRLHPPVSARIADLVEAKVNKAVAWWGDSPPVRQHLDRSMTVVGKIVVRGVFYPLMVLIPLTAFAFIGWQIVEHWHGPIDLTGGIFHAIGSGLWWTIKATGLVILMALTGGTVLTVTIIGTSWVATKAEERWPTDYQRRLGRKPVPDSGWHRTWRIGMASIASRFDWLGDVVEAGGTRLLRWTPVRLIGLGIYGLGMALLFVVVVMAKLMRLMGLGLWALVTGTGRGIRTTGRFAVTGHHAVKDRTCPRILVTGDQDS